MRLDLSGRSLGGSTRVWLDNAPLALPGTAGNPQWWNGQPLFQLFRGMTPTDYILATYPYAEVDQQGQSHLFASAGTDFWARQLGPVYKDSRGLERGDWAVVAVDDVSPRAAVVVNGGLWVWDGTALTSVEPSGADTWETGDIHFSRGVLGYRKRGQLVTWGRSAPVQIPGAGVRFDGEFVLAWQEGRGLVLHTWTSSRGIVIATGDNFHPDIRDLGNGRVIVVAGINEGDEGEHRYEIDWNAGTVNGLARDRIDLLAPVAYVEPYGRVLPHVAIYALAGDRGYGDYPDACLDAAWCGDLTAVALANALGLWVIAGASLITHAVKQALIWVASDTPSAASLEVEIARALPVARELGLGLYIHNDDALGWNGTPPPPNIPKGAICGVKAYRRIGEDRGSFLRRVSAEVLWCSANGYRPGLTIGIDDQKGQLSERELIEVCEMCVAMVRSLHEIAINIYFSYGRHGQLPDGTPIGGGLIHPSVWAWALASQAAATKPVDWTRYRLEPVHVPPPVPPPIHTPPPTPIPAPVIPPAPVHEDSEMKLPARCYALLHNGNIAAVVPGPSPVLELNYSAQEYGGYQEVEVTQSQRESDKVLVRFTGANRLFRVDTVLAQQLKFSEAIQLYDPAHADADSGWQHGVASGPFIHYRGPDVNGRLGIVYTLTMVDKDGQLFR